MSKSHRRPIAFFLDQQLEAQCVFLSILYGVRCMYLLDEVHP